MPIAVVAPRQTLFLIMVVFVIGAGGLLAYVYLPKATITIYPASSARTKEQDIILSTTAQEPDFVRFVLPAKVLRHEASASKDIVRSGIASHDDLAHGQVVLHNDQDEAQSLLPKTHLRHKESGVFFLTDAPVKIPAHSTVLVGVTAKEKGATGNVAPGTFLVDKLPVSLQALVFGTSDLPFAGGTVVDTPLTQEELTGAQEAVATQATQEALTALSVEAGGTPVRSDLLRSEPISQESSAPVGSLASSYTVKATVKATAFLADENDLLSLTLLALRSHLGPDEEFVSYDPKSFAMQIVTADFERGQARVKGKLTGLYAQKISPTAVETASLAGLTSQEVAEKFKQLPGIGKTEVALSPFWVTTVPARPGAITVQIANK